MLVFWNKKLVFLSVPKTGTTAIEAALAPVADMVIANPPELKHAPVYRYNRFFRPMFERACNRDDMELMAVMREPVSWLASWYRYRRRDSMRGHRNSTHEVSFDEFVQEYMKGDKKAPFANVGSQAKFLEPRPNGVQVDHLFRYEDQPKMLAFLEARLDQKITLERRNSSPSMPLDLPEATLAKLRRKCAAEFELYESLS
ncbi:sulfotransferase family 2 domain-containing protein [Shimia sp. R9_1]|uniref:sulfotransferase family 2 domain-containing protein n=1 Tax=unclassified Shimia TaxID=2630038 RepID=UPI001ADAA9C8|nr:sulfotransferase family 2 domain-containing protein [Shimia sp. R9_1]MBO9408381.1 sulfotransferase family 2 domain-containing protein [Shimia sp. R9_1]